MKYLKVWTSFREVIEPLSDAEKGRLFVMMLMYAESFMEPDNFTGNERFIWPAAKQLIDLTYSESLRLAENGKKGGRPKSSSNQKKPTETKLNQEKPTETQKEKKSNIKKGNNNYFDRFWFAYPRKVAKEDARKKFEKLNPDEELLRSMLQAIDRQKKSEQWIKDGGQYIPHPSTWLNQRRWEDELPETKMKVLPAQDFNQRDYSEVDKEMVSELGRELAEFMKGAG